MIFSEHKGSYCIALQRLFFWAFWVEPYRTFPMDQVSVTACEQAVPALQGLKSRMKVPTGWVML